MLRKYLLPFILFSFLLISTSLSAKEQTLYFKEDGRTWVFNGDTKIGEQSFIPEGQDPKNWEEMIIINSIQAPNVSLDVYYQNFIGLLNKKMGDIFKSKIVAEDENHLIFEWWIDPKQPDAQHGWIRITKTANGLQFFRYTTKDLDKVDASRAVWETILTKYDVNTLPENINVRINFNKDSKVWAPAKDAHGGNVYYPSGQSEKDWNEQLYVKVLPEINTSPYDFYYNLVKEVEKSSGHKTTSQIIDANNESIFFEIQSDDPDADIHLIKFNLYPTNLGTIIHYTAKKTPKEDPKIEIWKEIIKETTSNISYKQEIIQNENEKNNTPNSN